MSDISKLTYPEEKIPSQNLYETDELKTKIKESTEYLSKKIDIIKEGYAAYDHSFRETIKQQFKTSSAYLDPTYETTVDYITSKISSNLPSFVFSVSNKYSGKAQLSIARQLEQILKDTGFSKQITSGINKAMFSGLFIGELVITPNFSSNNILVVDENNELKEKDVFTNLGAKFVFNTFDVLKDEVLIDPNADPFDLQTADYIIINKGYFSEDKMYGMGYDVSEIDPYDVENVFGYRPNSKNYYTLHQMYKPDGTIESYINLKYLADTKLNTLGCHCYPLTIFSLFPWVNDVYGQTPWEKTKQSCIFKSGITNLLTTNSVKNLTSPLLTDSAMLASQGSLENIGTDAILQIDMSGTERPVRDRFSQLQYVDMTSGLSSLYNIIETDTQKTTGLSNLSFGIQQKTVRSTGIAEQMQGSENGLRTSILAIIEKELYTKLGTLIISGIYNKYPLFKFNTNIARDVFKNISAVQVVNGSLEGDKALPTLLTELFQLAASMPNDFSVTDILTDYFKSKGLNIDAYKSSPQEALLKILLADGLSYEMAQNEIARISSMLQQSTQPANGGAK